MIEPRPGTDPKLYYRFMAKVAVADGCWLWKASRNKDGYGMIGFRRRSIGAHRVSYVLFRGDQVPGLSVLHTCDVPACVNPFHLYLGTQAQNVRDRVIRGRSRHPFGENHGRAKLSADDVTAIRAALAAGCVQRRLAERYDVTPTTILGIKNGRIWRTRPA